MRRADSVDGQCEAKAAALAACGARIRKPLRRWGPWSGLVLACFTLGMLEVSCTVDNAGVVAGDAGGDASEGGSADAAAGDAQRTDATTTRDASDGSNTDASDGGQEAASDGSSAGDGSSDALPDGDASDVAQGDSASDSAVGDSSTDASMTDAADGSNVDASGDAADGSLDAGNSSFCDRSPLDETSAFIIGVEYVAEVENRCKLNGFHRGVPMQTVEECFGVFLREQLGCSGVTYAGSVSGATGDSCAGYFVHPLDGAMFTNVDMDEALLALEAALQTAGLHSGAEVAEIMSIMSATRSTVVTSSASGLSHSTCAADAGTD